MIRKRIWSMSVQETPDPGRRNFGHSKGKDNLYACSVLAVRPDTGELKWYFQMVPGDSWDYDSVQQLLLADITVKGRPRKVIMQANKDGFYYVIDRVTGQFISGQPFAQVTWARGLNEETGRPIVNEARTTARKRFRSRPDRAARTTGLPCRSTPPRAWSTFPPLRRAPTTSRWKKTSPTNRAKRIAAWCGKEPGSDCRYRFKQRGEMTSTTRDRTRPPASRTKEEFSGGVGSGDSERALARPRRRWDRRRHGYHRRESGFSGDSGWAAGRVPSRHGREAIGRQDWPARRHGPADHLSDRWNPVRLFDGRNRARHAIGGKRAAAGHGDSFAAEAARRLFWMARGR